ncbi:MAG: 4'-phosphopantetheinyl transferase superfamily protein [Spirochaetaceae bacterium]|jgi:phosphopantetheine--protein transferase-like protein|nr:4'-phosphopantetheinyl transferase superfamily protein [Spirochaetaceae bacterium]
MENSKDKLKKALAKTLNVTENSIDDSFSLNQQKLKSSAGTVILSNMVKKIYKQKIDCSGLATFGDLIARINGEENKITEDTENTGNRENHESSNISEENKPVNFPRVSGIHADASPREFSCGIDIQDISIFPKADDYWAESFYKENFTPEEIAYCTATEYPAQHFAARWCIKEALRKCSAEYASLPFSSINIKRQQNGSLCLEVYTGEKWQSTELACSMSHSGAYAVGMVTG